MTYNQGNETSLRVQRDIEIINAFELIFWRVPYDLNENNKQIHMKRACKLFTFKSMIMFLCEFHTSLNKKIIIV